MTEFLTLAAAAALLTALAGLWRGWRGPAAMDRIMAVQFLGTSAIATMALLAFALDEPAILDAALVLALRQHGIVACLRDSAGQAVDGGCGQLRARTLDGTPAVRRVLRAD